MTEYLYGASIQGIQGFIFETNKLIEIVGASEIVEQLCGSKFDNFIKAGGFELAEDSYIIKAAGNIRLVTDNKDLVEYIVKFWPKEVESLAPGITLSQAVVELKSSLVKDDMDQLEQKLKTQRNRASVPAELSTMVSIRSRRTGKPAIDWKDGKGSKDSSPRDTGSKVKQNAGSGEAPGSLMTKCIPDGAPKSTKHHPFNVEDICSSQESNWLAVIHADGNSLGKIIQGMSEQLSKNSSLDLKDAYSKFSRALDISTTNATKAAVSQVCLKNGVPVNNEKYLFRPVVVGGDDLTVIIRADLAIEFTEVFLKAFAEETKKNMAGLVGEFKLSDFENGLTACAGIAYMKASFPFHYAVELAEQLCGDAKKESKAIDATNVPSSISFHKIQDSFIEEYSDCIKRELTPNEGISFKFGPYGFEGEGLASVSRLISQVRTILEPNAPKSGIRKWLGLLHSDASEANLWMDRVKEVTSDEYTKQLKLSNPIVDSKTHLYDVMTLATLMKTETLSKEEKK